MAHPVILAYRVCSDKDCAKSKWVPGRNPKLEITWNPIRQFRMHIFKNHVLPCVSSFLHGRNMKTEIVVWYGRNRVNRVLISDVRSQRSLLLITRCSEINNFRFLTCSPIVPTLLLLLVTFNPKPSGAFKINCSIFIQNGSKVWLLEWNHMIHFSEIQNDKVKYGIWAHFASWEHKIGDK